jgi:hypothetical protein
VSLTSGAVAGFVSVVMTNPLDVVRTRLQIYDVTKPAEALLIKFPQNKTKQNKARIKIKLTPNQFLQQAWIWANALGTCA